MAFLTIRLESGDDATLDENRAHAIRKALASLLELELRRDFQSVGVTLHDAASGPELVAALRAPHDLTKLTEPEQLFLNDLNEMMGDSPYQLMPDCSVVRRSDGEAVPGVGCDWRAALRAVNQQGGGLMPGLVASIIDGAEEVERRQAAHCATCNGSGQCPTCAGLGCTACDIEGRTVGACPHCQGSKS